MSARSRGVVPRRAGSPGTDGRGTGPRGAVGLLALLTAGVVGGSVVAAPAVMGAGGGGGGGRGLFVAAGLGTGGSLAAQPGGTAQRSHPVRTARVRSRVEVDVHRDDRDRRRTTYRERRTTADRLVATNEATAVTEHCTGCTAVALAVQVVVNGGNDGHADVHNLAQAVTVDCVRCSATALAYQFVVVGPGRLRLSRDAHNRIRDLRHRMRDVARSSDPADLQAAEDDLAAQIAAVLRSGVEVEDRERRNSYAPLGARSRSAGGGVTVKVRRAHDTAHGRSR